MRLSDLWPWTRRVLHMRPPAPRAGDRSGRGADAFVMVQRPASMSPAALGPAAAPHPIAPDAVLDRDSSFGSSMSDSEEFIAAFDTPVVGRDAPSPLQPEFLERLWHSFRGPSRRGMGLPAGANGQLARLAGQRAVMADFDAALAQLEGLVESFDRAHADGDILDDGNLDQAADVSMYEYTLREHTLAQASARRTNPTTVRVFAELLRQMQAGGASWRPASPTGDRDPGRPDDDDSNIFTRARIEARDPDLHEALARLALASRLKTLLQSGGNKCGLELFERAWRQAGAAHQRPEWVALAARTRALSKDDRKALDNQVMYAVETRDWSDQPLVSDLAHAIATEVARLPVMDVTACLVAALKKAGLAD